jgi:hypothetical protein
MGMRYAISLVVRVKQLFYFLLLALGLGYGVVNYVPQLEQVRPTEAVAAISVPDPVIEGGKTYDQFCRHCHDFKRDGRLTDSMDLSYYRGELTELQVTLSYRRGDMPTFEGMFEAEELSDLHAYMTY